MTKLEAERSGMEISKINQLTIREFKAIFCTIAMMSYNPSIGRVLTKGGVDQFIIASWNMFQKLGHVQTIDELDKWHSQYLENVKDSIGFTSRGEHMSYGQAQKPVNVFLKVYVDWASLPNSEVALRLRPWLHVPLDSVVMKHIKEEFPQQYTKFGLKLASLSLIDKYEYYSWQKCFREIYSNKPLLIDVVWANERFKEVLKMMTN